MNLPGRVSFHVFQSDVLVAAAASIGNELSQATTNVEVDLRALLDVDIHFVVIHLFFLFVEGVFVQQVQLFHLLLRYLQVRVLLGPHCVFISEKHVSSIVDFLLLRIEALAWHNHVQIAFGLDFDLVVFPYEFLLLDARMRKLP